MSTPGYRLVTLRMIGADVKPADVTFDPGLNVITGASNTGKSYIAACLKYMAGGETSPKRIEPHDAGYETVLLELEERSGQRVVLERSLKSGGDFREYRVPLKDWNRELTGTVRAWKHDPRKDTTISAYYLGLSGLLGKKILMDGKGKTRPVSYMDVCRFTMIDEVQIITERTPVLASVQHHMAVECRSLFKVFLTGEDYSSVIAEPDPKVQKAQWQATKQVYDELVQQLEAEVKTTQQSPSDADRLKEFDEQLASLGKSIEDGLAAINAAVQQRKNAAQQLRDASARLMGIDQLLARFELLKKHYETDQKRLRFIREADHFLAQLGGVHCPICGALLEEHDAERLRADEATKVSLQHAAGAEAAKIDVHLEGLAATTAALNEERKSVGARADVLQRQVSEQERTIREVLQPRLASEKADHQKLLEARTAIVVAHLTRKRLDDIIGKRTAMGAEPKAKKGKLAGMLAESDAEKRAFCDTLEATLRSWSFPGVGTVEFGDKMEVVVAGKTRQSHGKGYRAILHAAFTISLMVHCVKKGRGHPHVVVLDSPLTSYKEGDIYEVTEDVQFGFYTALSKLADNQQLIILENKPIPAGIPATFKHTHFSGPNGAGRRGFYPLPGGKT